MVLYAGTVSHKVTGWLNKNRDPINDTVVYLLKKSKTCTLMCKVNMDHPSQTKEEEDLPPLATGETRRGWWGSQRLPPR